MSKKKHLRGGLFSNNGKKDLKKEGWFNKKKKGRL